MKRPRAVLHDARKGASGTVVLLSANPIHDTGGGQRSAQLALEFLERGWAVVFVSHGVVTETVHLGLRYDEPRLVQWTLSEALEPEARESLLHALSEDSGLVVTQVPVADWLPFLREAAEVGATTVYDCIDRWASELGRGWYRRSVEEDVARASHVLVASAPALVDHLEELTGRPADLLPNAFNARIFDEGRSSRLARPSEYLEVARVALYVGALWGGWMDWSLVRHLARSLPNTTFVFVGDHRGEGRGLPDNCVFTGLRPQTDLPAFLAHADVAILPWRVDGVTDATSPLKVYEFVAMGLPAVAPAIEPLRGIPGVRTEDGADAFVRAVGSVGRVGLPEAERRDMRAFAETNSWGRRVDRLLEVAATKGRRPAVATGSMAGHGTRAGACISVVVPAYDHEDFIDRALDSVLGQTLSPSEVVVVDDGSRDGTADRVARRSDPGLRLFRQSNRGAHHALNRAIRLSRGDWLAVLNSDDEWSAERLEHAWSVVRETGAALVIGTVELVDGDGVGVDPDHEIARWYDAARRWTAAAGSLGAALRRHNVGVTTSNFFVHRALWRRLGGFRSYRYVHDWDFLSRAVAMHPGRVVFEPALGGVRYRVHAGNTITDGGGAERERRLLLGELRAPLGRLRRRVEGVVTRKRLGRDVEASSILDPVGPAAVRSYPEGDGATARARPRVGLVVESLDLGGLEEAVALLAQALPASGVDVSVACTDGGGAVARRLERSGIDVTVFRGATDRVAAWAGERGIDIANSHFAPLRAFEALAEAGIPVVETVQNCYAWLDDDGWSRERRRVEVASGVVAVSDLVGSYYERRTGCRPDWIVPNAVHPARAARAPRAFARRVLGLPDGVPSLAFVGRITEQKNPSGLLQGFRRALDAGAEAVLLLAGPADRSASLGTLRRDHADLFRGGLVRHLPTLRHVGTVLSAADAYVSNAFYEGWSVAASEAAWAGRPLILSETGGSAGLVGEGGRRGVMIPNPCGDPLGVDVVSLRSADPHRRERNVDALAHAITDVVGRLEEWRRREPDIRGWARQELSPDVFSRRYRDLLLEAARR